MESSDSAHEGSKMCKNIARKIRNPCVKEEYICKKLEKIIECEDRLNTRRFNEKPPYSFELYHYRNDPKGDIGDSENVTLLHLAISCNRDEVASMLNDHAPSLSKASRTDDAFKGQTPFHIAVAKGKHDLVQKMMSVDMEDKSEELLKGKASGSALKGTIMMGETPLSIAVLKCDYEMIQLLLENGADVMLGDKQGNTIMHTIVMYTYHFPEKNLDLNNQHFKRATECLKNQDHIDDKRLRTLMHIRNKKGLTPLQLACKKGLDMVFEYFINLDNIYRFNLDIWGVEDSYRYDITEIDTVHWNHVLQQDMKHHYENKLQPKNTDIEESPKCCGPCEMHLKIHKRPSVLQAISHLAIKNGARFMSIDILDEVISKKWDYYKRYFGGFLIAHLILMVSLTVETVYKIAGLNLKSSTFGDPLDQRFLPMNVMNILFASLYIIQEGVRRIFYRQPFFSALRLHHNTICRFLFLFFGITLLIDSIWNFVSTHNYIRYIALFLGWFGMIFFLRPIRFCGYHSVVFLEIITGDIIKFLPVVIITIVPFTAAAYESFGNRDVGFYNYPETVLTLFQWMNGLGEIDQIQHDTKPGLSITVFVLFIIFGQIIILQTLIALMSNNHINDVNRLHLHMVQKLSVIVFFESMFLRRLMKGLGEKDTFECSTGDITTQYYLQVNRAHVDDIEWHKSHNSVRSMENLLSRFGLYSDNFAFDRSDDTMDSTRSTSKTRIETIQIQ